MLGGDCSMTKKISIQFIDFEKNKKKILEILPWEKGEKLTKYRDVTEIQYNNLKQENLAELSEGQKKVWAKQKTKTEIKQKNSSELYKEFEALKDKYERITKML